jgi:hypothetical protein
MPEDTDALTTIATLPPWHLLLDDLDLPNRRVTIAGQTQRLGELTDRALRAWLTQRRTALRPHGQPGARSR